jgi:hypothetical protein
MAGTKTKVTEDGVHFLKFDDSPTELDPLFYHMHPTEDVVVDGDQYYWVRIGNVKAKMLSSNAVARLVCKYGLYLGALGAGGVVGAVASGAEVGSLGAATPIVLPVIGVASGFIIGIAGFSDEVCQKFETWFVNNKYQVVASDGTILTGVAKNNTAGIRELEKHGLDITKLTHLTKKEGITEDL